MRLHLSNGAAAFLLVTLGTACGGSFSATPGDDSGPSESDHSIDAERPTYRTRADDSRATDGGDRADQASLIDSSTSADSGSYPDIASSDDMDGSPEDGGRADSSDTEDGRDAPTAVAVNLRTAADFVILAETAISTVPSSAITGNVGVSPAAITSITGFSLVEDSTGAFSTCPQIAGKVYGANQVSPTPASLTTAVGDMQRAFVDAAGRTANTRALGAGDIGGLTLTPGVYQWDTALAITKDVKLTGSSTDVWIFQVAQTLSVTANMSVFLTGGAAPDNVFWQVSGLVDLGANAHLEGIILTQTSVALHAHASVNGRLLAQTAITLDSNTVIEPDK